MWPTICFCINILSLIYLLVKTSVSSISFFEGIHKKHLHKITDNYRQTFTDGSQSGIIGQIIGRALMQGKVQIIENRILKLYFFINAIIKKNFIKYVATCLLGLF